MFGSRNESNGKPADRPMDRIPSAPVNPMDRIPSFDSKPASANPMDRIPFDSKPSANGFGDRFSKAGNGDKLGGFSSRPPFRG